MEIPLEMQNALTVVERIYDKTIADPFEIGIFNNWLKVTITPEMYL